MLDPMNTPGRRTCAFPGCERPVAGRGYCSAHHKQLMKGGPLKPLRQRNAGKVCACDGCERTAKVRGLCQSHYAQVLRRDVLHELRYQVDYDRATCAAEGCEKRPVANGLCKYHYQVERRRWIDDLKLERGCADCGYRAHPAALDFHHTDPAAKSVNVSRIGRGSREDILREIDQCIVLCANCHKRRHAKPAHPSGQDSAQRQG